MVYGDALSFVLAIVLLAGLRVPCRPPGLRRLRPSAGGLRSVLADRRYLGLTAVDFFSSFHATAMDIALPLWIALHTHAPRALIGVLFTLNTGIVVLVQVRATAGLRVLHVPRACRRAAASVMMGAGSYLAAHYVSELAAIGLLAIGLAAHTATEMFASAAEWITSIELANDDQRGAYLSVFSTGYALQRALGPTIITSLLVLGNAWLWPAVAAIVCTGTLLTGVITRRATGGQQSTIPPLLD